MAAELLAIIKAASLHLLPSIVNLCPLHIQFVAFFIPFERAPRSEAPCITYYICPCRCCRVRLTAFIQYLNNHSGSSERTFSERCKGSRLLRIIGHSQIASCMPPTEIRDGWVTLGYEKAGARATAAQTRWQSRDRDV